MRALRDWAVLAGVLAITGGCHDGNTRPSGNGAGIDLNAIPSKVEVLIDGSGKFPKELIGIWQEKQHGWEFVFDPNGSLMSVVISMGRVRIQPGVKTVVPMIQDGRGEYEPGQWMVHYDPVSRILTVAITIQKLRVEVAENIVVGGSHDTFVGEVPPAGQAWHAVWTSFPKYQASTDGGQTFVPLEAPDEYGLEQNVIFEKIVESNP